MSVSSVADELYGLPLDQFTGARNERARAARDAGDRALAEQIRTMRKPTVAAWLANQVVRHDRELIESLLMLGQELRTALASASGREMPRLNARRRELVQAIQQRSGELAESMGHPASEQVLQGLADILRAALADPKAAEALVSGCLTEALIPATFPEMLPDAGRETSEKARPSRTAAPARERDELGEARRKLAEQAVAAAQDRLKAARQMLKQAAASRDHAINSSSQAAERVAELRAELADATAELDNAEQAEEAANSAYSQAELAVRAAEVKLHKARHAQSGMR